MVIPWHFSSYEPSTWQKLLMAGVKPGMNDLPDTSLQVSASLMWEALARHHVSLPRACSIAASSCSRHRGCSAEFVFGMGKSSSLVDQLPDLAFLGGLPLKQKEREPKHWLEFSFWQNIFAFPFLSRITIFTRWKIAPGSTNHSKSQFTAL